MENGNQFTELLFQFCEFGTVGLGEKEIVGTLMGFDDYVNMVLEDVVEYENTVDGKRVTKLDTILLNGNHITMLVPGGEGPEV